MVAIAVIGALAVAGVLILLARSPGPPGAPGTPRAAATTCGDPCTEIRPRVEVTWTAPTDGGEVTGYRVERDGELLPGAGAIDPASLVLIDDGVELGRTYTYRVIAFGEEGSSLPSSEATAEIGLPAAGLAQLDGVYDVRLKVRSARSLAAMLGIDQPVPGKRGTDQWTFDSTCSPQDAACPTTWEALDGVLRPDGAAMARVDRRPRRPMRWRHEGPGADRVRPADGRRRRRGRHLEGPIVHGHGLDPVRVPGVRAVDRHARGDRPQRMSALTGPRSRASA